MSTSPVRDGAAPIAPPQTINGLIVVGAIPEQSGAGMQCHLWVVMAHDPRQRPAWDYVTWRVGCGGPGDRCGTFNASAGISELSWEEAVADMARRARVLVPAAS